MPPRKTAARKTPARKQPAAIAAEPKDEVQETPVFPLIPVVEPPVSIYRRAPRYEWIEYRPQELPDDAEGLKVRILANLSHAELDAIPYGVKLTLDEIYAAIAPYVVEWNAPALNLETGEWETASAPAVAGPDAFKVLGDEEAVWLIMAIKFRHRQKVDTAAAKKDLPTSTPTDSP